ncbi:TPA: hypothetical protein ACTXXA_000649 [Legionella anisa]
MRKSIGSEKKQLNTSKQEKASLHENGKREKVRAASKNHRERQKLYTQNLTDKFDELQNEEQELINKINDLNRENMALRKRQQLLRDTLTDALTHKTMSTDIEEPSLNTPFTI